MSALPNELTGAVPVETVSPMPSNDVAVAPRADITEIDVATRDGVMPIGGMVQFRTLDDSIEEARSITDKDQQQPMISGLAAHIKNCWDQAKTAKEQNIEKRMVQALRQRNGEYDPDKRVRLLEQNSSLVYMLLTSNKCRAASAWVREALQGMPWSCKPTPVSDVDDETKMAIQEYATNEIERSIMMGVFPTKADVKQFMLAVRDQAFAKIQELAKQRAERMTQKMKDQMFEGGFENALDQFIDDLVTFPAAVLKGPVVRTRPQLKWSMDQTGKASPVITEAYRLEWERVDPFNLYPAPDATDVDDGYLIERHRLSREDLASLRGVEGYSADAINTILNDYGTTGFTQPLSVDNERQIAEQRMPTVSQNPSQLIEALQFWGSVQGKMLIDWGLPEEQIEDAMAEYHVECWLINNTVIKATVNPDPLHRKPYYKTSWENIPGQFWGRSIPDLCRDTQDVCNAAARELVNNMSLASGPQVAVDISKIPVGENLTEMYPWKIWQFSDNGMAPSAGQPISFFQPGSNAQELMTIYEKFATLADEYTGIPRYMTGDSRVGGAGQTASGMSMLMSNAGKTIKNVVASVDRILKPAIERLYFYNMMYLDDPELKGDVNIVAEGAEAMMLKQQQQQKQLEALNMICSNPVASQIVGAEGIAYMLREFAKNLGLDTDRIVPDTPILKARLAEQQLQQMAAMQQQLAMQQQAQGQPQAGGSPAKPGNELDQRRLMDGSPQAVTQVRQPAQANPQLKS